MAMLNNLRGASKTALSRASEVAGRAASSASASAKTARENRKQKKHEDGSQYLVALDVGTEMVKALIGKVPENGNTDMEIIGVGRRHQRLTDMESGAIADIAGVVQNCDEALAEAEEQAGISVRTAIIGIAGELVKGTTTTVRCSRKQSDKPLDIAEMEKIIKLVQERAEIKAKKQLEWELGGKQVDVRLVNSALVSIEIDGYPVTSPIGFQGKNVVVQLYTAFAPMIHIGALEKTAQELDLDLLAVAAEPFAVARSVLGNDSNASMSAVLMDIGGGTTDIAVINEGGVQGTKMFGIGGRAYTHAIERDLDVDYDQAELLKVNLDNDKVSDTKKSAIKKSLGKTLDVWTSGVELALGEFDKLDHLPHRVLLCGGGSSLEMLMDELAESDWYSDLPFTRKPVVKHIKPEEVSGIVDTTGSVTDHTFVTAMGLLRVGLDTLNTSIETDQPVISSGSIKDRLNRVLRV